MARLNKVLPDTLSLDLANPRIPDAKFTDEEAAIAYLYAQADVGELIQSIGNSGWLDFEPLIVENQHGPSSRATGASRPCAPSRTSASSSSSG